MTVQHRPTGVDSQTLARIRQGAASSLAETELPPLRPPKSVPRLRRYQLIAVLVVLIAGAVGAISCVQLQDELVNPPQAVAQTARYGSAEDDLIAARNLAATQLLGSSTGDTTQIAADLASAATKLTAAVAADSTDAAAVEELSPDLQQYSYQLHVAGANSSASGTAALASADQILDQSLAPKLEALRQQSVASAARLSLWSWLALGAALTAVVTLILISVATARLTHRRVNLGLLIAAACTLTLLIIANSTTTMVTTATTTASTSLQAVTQVVETRLTVANVHRSLLTGATKQSWSAQDAKTATESIDLAESTSLTTGSTLASQSFYTATQDATDALSSVNSALQSRRWSAADEDLAATATLSTSLADVRQQADVGAMAMIAKTDSAASGVSWMLGFAAIGCAVAALIGAISAIWGLNKRIVEYR
jgi:hypothetical protein